MRDAAGLDDVAEQAEVGEVEADRHSGFQFDEGILRKKGIVRHISGRHTS
jgi:hypothetical protein